DAANIGPDVHVEPRAIRLRGELEAGVRLDGAVDADRLVVRDEREPGKDREDARGDRSARALWVDEHGLPETGARGRDPARKHALGLRAVLVAEVALGRGRLVGGEARRRMWRGKHREEHTIAASVDR